MFCWMGENWVIYWGVWILWNIFDDNFLLLLLDVLDFDFLDGEYCGKLLCEIMVYY